MFTFLFAEKELMNTFIRQKTEEEIHFYCGGLF